MSFGPVGGRGDKSRDCEINYKMEKKINYKMEKTAT